MELESLNIEIDELLSIFEEKKEKNYKIFWKEAKLKEDMYSSTNFEEIMLSSPYKYDLKIKSDTNIKKEIFTFKLLNSLTMIEQESKKELISIESIEYFGEKEVVIRFKINVCSFHYSYAKWVLLVEDSEKKVVYLSKNFMTCARRKENLSPLRKENLSPLKNQIASIKKPNNMCFNQKILKKDNVTINLMKYLKPVTQNFINFQNQQNSQIVYSTL
jgi:hypothetical protein